MFCGPCTHLRPLHLFFWPLHINKWPLHPILFTRFVALAHGPCTGPCPRKMSLFGRLRGMNKFVGSFFGRIQGYQKVLSKLIDLYNNSKLSISREHFLMILFTSRSGSNFFVVCNENKARTT